MIEKLSHLRAMSFLIVLSQIFISVQAVNNAHSYVVYSPEQMQEHKRKCMEQMRSNPKNHKDSTYQMQRALKTVSGDDVDYIPKVIGAGEIFYDELVPYQLMHNGVKVHLNSYYDVQWLTDVIHGLKGHHEPQEEKCFYEVLKYIPENAIMIELGSYWAYYSLWFLSEMNNAKSYLIEPDARRLEVGRKNFELNNRVGVFKWAFVGVMKDCEANATGAEYISIDDFIESQGIEHVTILHADIQGAEYEMLKTTVKHLDKIDYFFISTHGTPIHQSCLHFFNTHRFIILAEHDGYESCSGDGLIVAKRNNVVGPVKITIRKY